MNSAILEPDTAALEEAIQYRFKKKQILHESLCHKSYAYDGQRQDLKHNERLEFLGDAVLGLVITDELFRKLSGHQEGELSIIKSTLIRKETLAALARSFDLGRYLLLSKGEENSGGRERDSILADAFEGLIGGIYLDSGIRAARKFILTQLREMLERIGHDVQMKEYKNLLQELVHVKFKSNPLYQIISETGPDHRKLFEATVSINGAVMGIGRGCSKKEAEKNAARAAYEKITNVTDAPQ